MRLLRLYGACLIGALLVLTACGPEEPPSRDHFPVLKEALNRLQTAVSSDDRILLDSLLTPKLRSAGGADSLMRFVFGPDTSFAFYVFGEYQIAYTNDKARIDCFIMDGTENKDRPLTLTYELVDDFWLLKRFETTDQPLIKSDSVR
jgi:hypothetical protein